MQKQLRFYYNKYFKLFGDSFLYLFKSSYIILPLLLLLLSYILIVLIITIQDLILNSIISGETIVSFSGIVLIILSAFFDLFIILMVLGYSTAMLFESYKMLYKNKKITFTELFFKSNQIWLTYTKIHFVSFLLLFLPLFFLLITRLFDDIFVKNYVLLFIMVLLFCYYIFITTYLLFLNVFVSLNYKKSISYIFSKLYEYYNKKTSYVFIIFSMIILFASFLALLISFMVNISLLFNLIIIILVLFFYAWKGMFLYISYNQNKL